MNTIDEIKTRWEAPTPPFFKRIRNIGLVITTIAGALVSIPDIVPELLVNIAWYLVAIGSSISTMSQVATEPTKSPARRRKSSSK